MRVQELQIGKKIDFFGVRWRMDAFWGGGWNRRLDPPDVQHTRRCVESSTDHAEKPNTHAPWVT